MVPALRLHETNFDEPEWIHRARSGDAVALDRIATIWSEPVWRYCYRLMPNHEGASDAAQDSLVKLVRTFDRYDPTRPLLSWVFAIARNTCFDHLRRIGRWREDPPSELADTSANALEQVDAARDAVLVRAALAEIPALYREVLILFHYEHLKYVEIAATLDVPLGTVMNRIFRARQHLAARLRLRGVSE